MEPSTGEFFPVSEQTTAWTASGGAHYVLGTAIIDDMSSGLLMDLGLEYQYEGGPHFDYRVAKVQNIRMENPEADVTNLLNSRHSINANLDLVFQLMLQDQFQFYLSSGFLDHLAVFPLGHMPSFVNLGFGLRTGPMQWHFSTQANFFEKITRFQASVLLYL